MTAETVPCRLLNCASAMGDGAFHGGFPNPRAHRWLMPAEHVGLSKRLDAHVGLAPAILFPFCSNPDPGIKS
jgi:hypothetical protein